MQVITLSSMNMNGNEATTMADKPSVSAGVSTRERSKIQFPYNPLNDGVEIARAIFQNGGQQGTMDQVAAWSKHGTTNSGTFKLKLYAARMFGLIEIDGDTIRLTELGNDILDPQKERQARAHAFLNVPLYREIFEKYKGKMLPSDPGLEAEMINLGVAAKQKDRARRIFQHSAQQAGLFALGRDLLILPGGMSQQKVKELPPARNEHPKAQDQAPPQFYPGSDLHPFIRGLLETLPPPESIWPSDKRTQWLKTAENIFGLIYKGNGETSDK